MIVLAAPDGFTVTDRADFQDFHVDVGTLSHPEFVAVVGASDDVQPHELPRHLWVSTAFLHRELGTVNHPERLSGLERMLAYAASKGWVNDDGTHVAAHIVVPG